MKKKIKSLLRIVSLFFYKYPTLYFSIYKIILVPLRLLDIKTFSKHVNKINVAAVKEHDVGFLKFWWTGK